MRHRASARRGERGQALAFVAICMVGLLGFAGLAIDGGLEAAHFRVSQNGTDAGALAAARQLYESNATASTSSLCGSPSGIGPKEISRNTVVPDSCSVRSLTSYVAAAPSGYQSYGAMTTVDESMNVNVGLNVDTLQSHIGVNEATASTAGSPTETASGSVDLASLSATLTQLGIPSAGSSTLFGCGSSQTTAGTTTTPTGGTCPQSSLALSLLAGSVNVTSDIGLTNPVPSLLKQSNSSTVPAASASASQQPQQRDSTQVVGNHHTVAHVIDETATVATTSMHAGTLGGTGDPSGVETESDVAHLSGTIGTFAFSADNIDVGARVSWDPRNGFTSTTSCSTTNITINGTAVLPHHTGTLTGGGTVYSGCDISSTTIGGLLTVKSDNTTNCQQGASGMVCSADVCFLDITLLSVPGLNSASVCIGKVHSSATFQPVTNRAAITVTGHVPTPTYFIRILGFTQTNPATTSTAMPQQVLDETAAEFTTAPYAVSYAATEVHTSDSAAYCGTAYGPLQPGCGYVISGSGIDDNPEADVAAVDDHGRSAACAAGSKCWQGKLSSSSPHAVGATVVPSSGEADPLTANIGSGYVLLPVIGGPGGPLTVAYFGLFKIDSANPRQATLVRTPDATNSVFANAVQATSDIGWTPDVEGAVSIKLVDTATLVSLGYT